MPRVGIALALFALILCAHVALPPPATFSLFLLCLTGAGLVASRHLVPSQTHAHLMRVDAADSQLDIVLDDDELAGLQAELHTLNDQYRTDAAQLDAPGAAPASSRT